MGLMVLPAPSADFEGLEEAEADSELSISIQYVQYLSTKNSPQITGEVRSLLICRRHNST